MERWEALQKMIATFPNPYVQNKRNKLYAEVNKLKQRYNKISTKTNPDWKRLTELEQNIEEVKFCLNTGFILNSHQTVIEEDKKPTRYFYKTLQARKAKNSLWELKFVNDLGREEITNDPVKIMNKTRDFYKNFIPPNPQLKTTKTFI